MTDQEHGEAVVAALKALELTVKAVEADGIMIRFHLHKNADDSQTLSVSAYRSILPELAK